MKRIVVIGAGHAGIEAAAAVARMGGEALLVTMHLDTIAQMSCNPSIGGIAKGHLVKEIDALGGVMPRAADATCIHFKILNQSKGAAVQATRTQNDKRQYRGYMKAFLEGQPGIRIYQSQVTGLTLQNHRVTGVQLQEGHLLPADAVVICTGTFLGGRIYIGNTAYEAGRASEPASLQLARDIRNLGIRTLRLKTGTPMRIHRDSIRWDRFIRQPGDTPTRPFSHFTTTRLKNRVDCYIGHTNRRVKEVIRRDMEHSPLYSGKIEGIGPRYCPSIEDKVQKFPQRETHQFYLEPEGLDTSEIYLSGLSSSLPVSTQMEFLQAIPGLEKAVMMRPAYAVEYDAVDATQLTPALESRSIGHLYFAGQVNGTSGYEEAAAQGLMAGINALLGCRNQPPLVLKRSEGYTGVLIDDLIHRGVDEPYRLFTSRAEFRLKLREDNAFERLGSIARKYGLIREPEYVRIRQIFDRRKKIISNLKKQRIRRGKKSLSLHDLLKRPEMTVARLRRTLRRTGHPFRFPRLSGPDTLYLEATIKYEGYIRLQEEKLLKTEKLKTTRIPPDIDYRSVPGLSTEIRQKLSRRNPPTLFEASLISGVTPAALNALHIFIRVRYRDPDH